jgi:hypothetical protein
LNNVRQGYELTARKVLAGPQRFCMILAAFHRPLAAVNLGAVSYQVVLLPRLWNPAQWYVSNLSHHVRMSEADCYRPLEHPAEQEALYMLRLPMQLSPIQGISWSVISERPKGIGPDRLGRPQQQQVSAIPQGKIVRELLRSSHTKEKCGLGVFRRE